MIVNIIVNYLLLAKLSFHIWILYLVILLHSLTTLKMHL